MRQAVICANCSKPVWYNMAPNKRIILPSWAINMMTPSNRKNFGVTDPLCGNSPVTGEFSTQRPMTRSFDVFFDLRLNKRLSKQSWMSKQSWGWWFETLSRSLWRHCNEYERDPPPAFPLIPRPILQCIYNRKVKIMRYTSTNMIWNHWA